MAARKRKQDDWKGHGDYMHAKIQKLDEQFTVKGGEREKDIFKGISIFINGYTIPPCDELRNIVCRHGGRFQQYYSRSSVTHIIATNLPDSKITGIRDKKIGHPQWILDSVEQSRLLPIESYLLYGRQARQKQLNFSKDSIKKPGITVEQKDSMVPAGHVGGSVEVFCEGDEIIPGKIEPQLADKFNYSDSDFIEAELHNDITFNEDNEVQHNVTTNTNGCPLGNESANQITESNLIDKLTKTNTSTERNEILPNETERKESEFSLDNKSTNQRAKSPVVDKATNQKQLKAGHAKFVSEFYNNSRLHYLSTWGAELKQFTSELIKTRINEGVQPYKYPSPGYHGRVIMHVDMDCFFVSVGLRNHPELVGKPVAVCHAGKSNVNKEPNTDSASSFTSMSEIASCSYEARKAGVKNGMFLGAARKLCPNIVCIPYLFQQYRDVSRKLYHILVNHTHDIEAVSCDEAYIDVSLVLNEDTTPLDLAKQIRNEIQDQTKCTASVGIGPNVLLARLCTRLAKPDGQYHVHGDKVQEFIGQQKVSDLPGVGRSLREKLHGLGVTTCVDLQRLSLKSLQDSLGEKTGLMVYRYGRGEDDRPLRVERERKSVSAEINYGIRFTEESEPIKFINELSVEVQKRLRDIESKGQSVCLKLKVRKKGAPEPLKFMGHGICDNIARSASLPVPTDDSKTIAAKCHHLLHQLKLLPSDIRGMGIQVNRLTQHKATTRTLHDFATTKPPQRTPLLERPGDVTSSTSANKPPQRTSPQERPDDVASVIATNKPLQKNGSLLERPDDEASLIATYNASQRTLLQERTGDITSFTPSRSPSNSFYSHEMNTPGHEVSDKLCFNEPFKESGRLPPLPPLPQFFPSSPSATRKRSIPKSPEPQPVSDVMEELLLPSPSQLDHNALNALPEEIRLSIQRQYAKRNNSIAVIDNKETITVDEETNLEEVKQEEQASLKGATSCRQVKTLLKSWTDSSEFFQEDVDVVVEYFLKLVERDNMEQLWILIKYLIRCISKSHSKVWTLACQDIIQRVQVSVIDKHGAPLALQHS